MASVSEPVERHALSGFEVWVAARRRPPDLAAEVARLADPGSSLGTLHWGRNYLYLAEMRTPDGPLQVVVKQHRNQSLRARLRRRWSGSKATKSWHMAHRLSAAGFHTPEPIMLIESRRSDGPSLYVSRYLEGAIEARYFFRALNAGREAELFPQVEAGALLAALGQTARRLHDAGIWYRDLSAGNLLVTYPEGNGSPPVLFLVDLNRARPDRRLGLIKRSRDLCRLPIFGRRHQDLLLAAYWGDERARWPVKRLLFLLFHRSFLLRNELKKTVRRPLAALAGLVRGRKPHAHIPPPPTGASVRDRAVWDQLSDQPHQHASRLERVRVRLADAGAHGEALGALLAATPRAWRRFRDLRRELYRAPCPWPDPGVAVRPWARHPEALVGALEELGTRRVLLRLHLWEGEYDTAQELARELGSRGFELAFGLAQNRELVRDEGRWRAQVEEVAARFVPLGRHFQIGQAINRSKWGVWNYREYLRLAASAAEILRGAGEVEILGPAVIDFEHQATAAVLNMRSCAVRFDVVTSLLYVDRRGAPERRQLGFDTVDKIVLLKAIAETARHGSGRCWITEFNWPLWEGPHSPAGRHVSVDEETQASYLVRYFLLALGSGLLERAYWWQAVARGYGLIDPGEGGELRRRPSFQALATLARQLAGCRSEGPLGVDPTVRLYRLRHADGRRVVVAWSVSGDRCRVRLPAPALRRVARDGLERALGGAREVEVDGAPSYFWLADEEPDPGLPSSAA